jgi:hypothetical protein
MTNLIWLGEHEPAKTYTWQPQFTYQPSIDALLTASVSPSLIVISNNTDNQTDILRKLRANENTALCLIFVEQESEESKYLSNGLWNKDYDQQLQKYLQRKQLVNVDTIEDEIDKLIFFLFVHSNFELSPKATPEKTHLYEYPLANAFGINQKDIFLHLKKMQSKNWFETIKMCNRVRYCPDCQSGHLNYIDQCPQCQGIEIDLQTSLHCFNCGHINTQEAFTKSSLLRCPNCYENLRHIGVDYDRPIENQHCSDCDTLFIDAKVQAACFTCGEAHDVDELQAKNIYSYKLSSLGRRLVAQGKIGPQLELDSSESITNSRFLWLLDWQNKLAERHKLSHTLMSIEILNMEEFMMSVGETKGYTQIAELQERIAGIVRETDSCANIFDNTIYILFSHSQPSDLISFPEKINKLNDLHIEKSLQLQVKTLALPTNTLPDDKEKWLLTVFNTINPITA